MILLLDTSTPLCQLTIVDGKAQYDHQWQADRQLAHGLLGYIIERMHAHDFSWKDINGIGVMQGPGSFTGLRIGLTVANTIADAEQLPIVGAIGDDWQSEVVARLRAGDNDKIILPFYGSDASITKPRK